MSFQNIFSTQPLADQKLTHGTLSGSDITPATESDSAIPSSTADTRVFARKSGHGTAYVNVAVIGNPGNSVTVEVYGIDPLLGRNVLLGRDTVTVGDNGETDDPNQGSKALSCKTSYFDWFVWLAAYDVAASEGYGVVISAFQGA